jgi:hypothetical protein
MAKYEVGQLVIAHNVRQEGLKMSRTRRVMEIASVQEKGYTLRKPGSNGKGGKIIWEEKYLEMYAIRMPM